VQYALLPCHRKVEDAIEKKQMVPLRLNIRMKPHHHANKNSPLDYAAFLAIPDSADSADEAIRSIFLDSKLALWGCNPDGAAWIAESAYRIPTTGKDATPVSSDKRHAEVSTIIKHTGNIPQVCGIILSLFKLTLM
jgi:hypothetical protein